MSEYFTSEQMRDLLTDTKDAVEALEEKVDKMLDGTNPANVQLTGSILQEEKTHVDAVNNIITFTENIMAIEIYHEGTTWQKFVINGLTKTVPPGGWARGIGGTPAKTVTIPAGVNCIVGRLS